MLSCVSLMEDVMAKAVVVDGSEIRIWEDNAHMGDPEYLFDTIQVPSRCRSEKERREWFGQTLLAKSLGDYEFA